MSIIVRPGALITPDADGLVLTRAPQGLGTRLTLGIVHALDSDIIVSAPASTGIEEVPLDDGRSNYGGTRLAPVATAESYRFVWYIDGEEVASEDLHVEGRVTADDVLPPIVDIAAILHERVQAAGGHEAVTFGADTNPTADQVQGIIDMQAPLMLIEFGDVSEEALTCSNADDVRAAIRALLAMRVAAVIELSYWPQDAVTGDTAEDFWRRIVEIETPKVVQAAKECRLGEIAPGDTGKDGGLSVAPVYQFQAGPRVGSRGW